MANSQKSSALSKTLGEVPYLLSVKDTDALKDLVQKRLEDCGWREHIRKMVRGILNKQGIRNVNCEEIAAKVIPMARNLVPEALNQELQLRVRDILKLP